MKAQTRLLAILGVLFAAASAQAVFIHVSLPSSPKADEVGEVIFNRSDWSDNHSEHVQMTREEFLRFFKDGLYRNDGATLELVYETKHFPKPLNTKGGWRYCSGAFATKSGGVFFWNRPREGVLEIEDNGHRTGWLILPEFLKQETIKQVAPADAGKANR